MNARQPLNATLNEKQPLVSKAALHLIFMKVMKGCLAFYDFSRKERKWTYCLRMGQ